MAALTTLRRGDVRQAGRLPRHTWRGGAPFLALGLALLPVPAQCRAAASMPQMLYPCPRGSLPLTVRLPLHCFQLPDDTLIVLPEELVFNLHLWRLPPAGAR